MIKHVSPLIPDAGNMMQILLAKDEYSHDELMFLSDLVLLFNRPFTVPLVVIKEPERAAACKMAINCLRIDGMDECSLIQYISTNIKVDAISHLFGTIAILLETKPHLLETLDDLILSVSPLANSEYFQKLNEIFFLLSHTCQSAIIGKTLKDNDFHTIGLLLDNVGDFPMELTREVFNRLILNFQSSSCCWTLSVLFSRSHIKVKGLSANEVATVENLFNSFLESKDEKLLLVQLEDILNLIQT